jgi:hypothetical protein
MSLPPPAPPRSSACHPKRSPAGALADPRVRLAAGTVVMLATAMAARRHRVSRCEATAFRAVNGLPDSLYPPAWVIMQPGRGLVRLHPAHLAGRPSMPGPPYH